MRLALSIGCSAAAGLLGLGASGAQAAETFYPAAPVAVLLTSGSYTQDFNTLAAAGTSSVLPLGWQVFEGGSNGNGTYAAGTGSSNAGNVYSFGSSGSSERALGSLGSGSVTPIYYGAFFTNGLAGAITDLAFSYTGEQWRAGSAGTDLLTFQYSFNAPNVRDGNWTTLSSLNFTSPNPGTTGAVNGNLAANQAALSGSLSGLSIANGETFAIRWFDDDTTGSDDGLGIDDFALNAVAAPVVSAVPEPATWAMMLCGFGLVGGAIRRRRTRTTLATA